MRIKLLVAVALLLTGYAVGRVSSSPVAAQAAAGHVYEMRTYTAAEGKLANVNARFRDHTVRIFAKHNMKSVGYWTPLEGPTAETTNAAQAVRQPRSSTVGRLRWSAPLPSPAA